MIGTLTLYETLIAYEGLALQNFFWGKMLMSPLGLMSLLLISLYVRGRNFKEPNHQEGRP